MIAIIPARGGSKGIAGKNIKPLLGKPLIAYTIEAAQRASSIQEIIVSTDAQDIADIAIEYGAICPSLRPNHLARDGSPSIDLFKHLFIELNSNRKDKVEEFIVLQPTSPLRKEHHIDEAVELYYEKNADSVISYTRAPHPIAWFKYLTPEHKFIDVFDHSAANRQEHMTAYYPNGAIFIFKRHIIEKGTYYSNNSFAYIMDPQYSVDIDSIQDLEYAEFLLNKFQTE